jgi:hypothetical protein
MALHVLSITNGGRKVYALVRMGIFGDRAVGGGLRIWWHRSSFGWYCQDLFHRISGFVPDQLRSWPQNNRLKKQINLTYKLN